MKKIFLASLLMLLAVPASYADGHKTTIFTIGDSTMANKPTEGDNPERGWGQMLPGVLSEDIAVSNHAVNGRSSLSFINEGRWDAVLDAIQPGDYVFIQFGHNDEKPSPDRHTDPGTTFDANLTRFVLETREKGGNPVLFNSIVRRNFGTADSKTVNFAVNQDDAFYVNPDARKVPDGSPEQIAPDARLIDTHGEYLVSPRRVAEQLDVPFVDMNAISRDVVEGLGPEDSKSLFVWVAPGECAAIPKGREDNTHLNVHGARLMASLTIDAVAEAVPALKPFVRHYTLVVAKDGSGDYFDVQSAIDAVPDGDSGRTTILVRPGNYEEAVIVPAEKADITLVGQTGAVIGGAGDCRVDAPGFLTDNVAFRATTVIYK